VWKSRLILEALHRWMPDAPYTATQALAIRQLLEAQVGRKVLLEVGKVWRERERLVFKCAAPENREEPRSLDLYPGDRFSTPEGVLTVAAESYLPDLPLDAGPDRVLLDAAKIAFPLQVRRWQSGDRLEPLGMRGHKKVSDLLTDERIPSYRRSGIRVVTSNQEIVWVVGVRIADRVKVNPDTVRVVRLTFERNPDSVKKD
jgi:tRNA(Ile)-lysidine synthase